MPGSQADPGEGFAAPPYPRRHYGRRSSRGLRPGRRALLLELLPELRVALPDGGALLQPGALFEDDRTPVWLEIGFGAGEHLAGQARANPLVGFIGCEPYVSGVASLLGKIEQNSLQNIRVHPDDARVLLDRIAGASLQRVFLLFPDPWPKRRHHDRRFVQKETVELLARALRAGGDLTFATDHADYAQWTLSLVTDHPGFAWCARRAADWRHPPQDWIGTRYEAKARRSGATCIYLRFRRTSAT